MQSLFMVQTAPKGRPPMPDEELVEPEELVELEELAAPPMPEALLVEALLDEFAPPPDDELADAPPPPPLPPELPPPQATNPNDTPRIPIVKRICASIRDGRALSGRGVYRWVTIL
jgi:hypothetical protein